MDNTSIDLTWIGNKSAIATNDDDDITKYICEFCNVSLIEKRDDINNPIYGPARASQADQYLKIS